MDSWAGGSISPVNKNEAFLIVTKFTMLELLGIEPISILLNSSATNSLTPGPINVGLNRKQRRVGQEASLQQS